MQKLLALAFAILVGVAVGCERGFPDEAPPTGKNEMNAATPKASFYGPSRVVTKFSKDALVEQDAGEEEEEE
jgi:hypothetical protein